MVSNRPSVTVTETTRTELALLFDDNNTTCVAITAPFYVDLPFYQAEMNITMTTNRSVDKLTIGLKVTFGSGVMCNDKRVTVILYMIHYKTVIPKRE